MSEDASGGNHGSGLLLRLGLAIFFTMNVMVFTMALWTWDVHQIDAIDPSHRSLFELFRYACLLFATPVLLILGLPLVEDVSQQLRQGRISTDVLLVAGVIASFIYSVVALLTGQPHVYFEVGCMVLVAVTLGRWVEATGKWKTTQSLRSLATLLPKTVRLIRHDNTSTELDTASVSAGDLIRVLPGERIAVDGTIEFGRAAIDEQMVTGEGHPRLKETGEDVYAGTLNVDGDLRILVKAGISEGTLQRLIDAVETAAHREGQEQRQADHLAAWMIPLVLVIAIVTFAYHTAAVGFVAGMMSALAVVLIACPCALAVATPLAVWGAMGNAARHQVLFRDGNALSQLAKSSVVLFDKTGTLTSGSSHVAELLVEPETPREQVQQVAAAAAECSTHSFSRAIRDYGTVAEYGARAVRNCAGMGLLARTSQVDHEVALGSPEWMQRNTMQCPPFLEDAISLRFQQSSPVVCVGWNGRVRGVFVLQEHLRPEAQAAIDQLKQLGLHAAILTGDNSTRAHALAESLGLMAHSGLLPDQKLDLVRQYQQRYGCVAMVGDGINDAPALAAADVGIAMACGGDLTRDAASVCLLANDLSRLPWSIRLAQSTVRTIHQNLFWALIYNMVGVGLAACGLLNPILAAIAMAGSSAFVVTNSLRLGASRQDADDASTEWPATGSHGPPAFQAESHGTRTTVNSRGTREAIPEVLLATDVTLDTPSASP